MVHSVRVLTQQEFSDTYLRVNRQKGFGLTSCSNGGRRKIYLPERLEVGRRGGVTHTWEEGKMERGEGLEITKREEGVI